MAFKSTLLLVFNWLLVQNKFFCLCHKILKLSLEDTGIKWNWLEKQITTPAVNLMYFSPDTTTKLQSLKIVSGFSQFLSTVISVQVFQLCSRSWIIDRDVFQVSTLCISQRWTEAERFLLFSQDFHFPSDEILYVDRRGFSFEKMFPLLAGCQLTNYSNFTVERRRG